MTHYILVTVHTSDDTTTASIIDELLSDLGSCEKDLSIEADSTAIPLDMSFPGSITPAQADAIVKQLASWVRKPDINAGLLNVPDRSTIAAIICDAVHEEITLQPLHMAYSKLFK